MAVCFDAVDNIPMTRVLSCEYHVIMLVRRKIHFHFDLRKFVTKLAMNKIYVMATV